MKSVDNRPEWAKQARIPHRRYDKMMKDELHKQGPMPSVYGINTGEYFDVPGPKKKVYIAPVDMELLYAIRKLTPSVRIEMVALSSAEMEAYLEDDRRKLRRRLVDVLGKPWTWRMTGEPAVIEAGMLPGTDLSAADLARKLKRRMKISRQQILDILDWFENDRTDREVYLRDPETVNP